MSNVEIVLVPILMLHMSVLGPVFEMQAYVMEQIEGVTMFGIALKTTF